MIYFQTKSAAPSMFTKTYIFIFCIHTLWEFSEKHIF